MNQRDNGELETWKREEEEEEHCIYFESISIQIGCFRTLRNTACSRKRQARIEMRDDGTNFPILRKKEEEEGNEEGRRGTKRGRRRKKEGGKVLYTGCNEGVRRV